MSCINGRGFNFDVAPSLVGIWCPLISRVGDVGGAWGKSKAERLDTEVRSKVNYSPATPCSWFFVPGIRDISHG